MYHSTPIIHLTILLVCAQHHLSFSFVTPSSVYISSHFGMRVASFPTMSLQATRKESGNSKREMDDEENDPYHCYYDQKRAPWEDELYCRINKKSLEDSWIQSRIKSRPRFLPYESCKEWAKHQNMWTSKEEWMEWIGMGEGKPSLVPSDPESHYSKLGTWISWEDFLDYS